MTCIQVQIVKYSYYLYNIEDFAKMKNVKILMNTLNSYLMLSY